MRSIAMAHLAACEKDATVGKWLYMSNWKFFVQMVLDIMNERTPGSEPKDILILAKTSNLKPREVLVNEWLSLELMLLPKF